MSPPTTQPVAPTRSPEAPPMPELAPAPAKAPGSLSPEQLSRAEWKELGNEATRAQVARVLAQHQVLREQTPDGPSSAANLDDAKQRSEETLQSMKLLQAGQSVEAAFAEFHKLLHPDNDQSESTFFTELKNFPPAARETIYTELIELSLKGHLSADILNAILPGGIKYLEKPTYQPPEGMEIIGYYVAADTRGKEVTPAHVELYAPLFTPEQKADPRYVVRHELAHATIGELAGEIYDTAELDALLGPHKGPRPGEGALTDAPKPQPLDRDSELAIFAEAIGQGAPVGRNPRLVKPFETAYVVRLLDNLEKNPNDQALRALILEEMLVERYTAFLSSDGTLQDFIAKRLEFSSAVANADAAPVPEGGIVASSHTPAAQSLDALLLKSKQALRDGTPVTSLLGDLQTYVQANGVEGQAMNRFLRESILLWKRFSKLKGGIENRPLTAADNPIRDDLVRKLRGGDLPTNWHSFLEAGSLPAPVSFQETNPLGTHPEQSTKKSFWRLLADAFKEFIGILGTK